MFKQKKIKSIAVIAVLFIAIISLYGCGKQATSISAKYVGSTKAGVEIGANAEDIIVTAKYDDASTQEITDWSCTKTAVLQAGKTSKIEITSGDLKTSLSVKCTTAPPLTKKQFKAKCKEYSYKKLCRYPDKYKGKKIKLKGEVIQLIADGEYMVSPTGYWDKAYHVINVKSSARILEGDKIKVFGTYNGIYSYETTNGDANHIPEINCKYVSF